ncbi:MAG: dinitrogenase iron-molybdenum cofactor biosynthesis protein [Desulfovibrio sp.]|nr:MAG: dinitrogenase iron-molybdenum cofactor biosynthesis protein [Desulfovibrio sp.]
MILCLACYNDRLASLYENAADFLLYEVDGCNSYPVGRLSLPQRDPMQRITALAAHGVTLVICGGICRQERLHLAEAGIAVTPWVCGDPETVLEAYNHGRLHQLTMPGCQRERTGQGPSSQRVQGPGRGQGRGLGQGRGQGRGQGQCRNTGRFPGGKPPSQDK